MRISTLISRDIDHCSMKIDENHRERTLIIIFNDFDIRFHVIERYFYIPYDIFTEYTWESEQMLLEDGCREAIDDLWDNTDTPRTLDLYSDKYDHPHY